jgi:serine/threonine protein kinase
MHFFPHQVYLTWFVFVKCAHLFNNLVFFQGALQDGQVVAIKVFKSSHGLSSDKEVARELDIISKVEHRDIVKCLGYVHEVQGRIVKMGNEMIHAKQTHFCLVQEYMSNGDMERINCGIFQLLFISV